MAEELSLDSIKDMKKAEYIKAFKNKAAWKKAKAVIFLVDYKLEGKKAVIAIPFKKENEMKLEMKRLKKEKLHLLKKSGGGEITITKGNDGVAELNVKLTIGGLKPELLVLKATPLLEKIKLRIKATIEGEALLDAASKEIEVDVNENLPEDNMEDVAVDESSNDVYEKDSVEAESEPEKPEVANVSDAIKQTLAKIAKFNKLINLKDGLQETDINNAEVLKAAIKDFAAQLKTASAEIRNEFGETFLKTKKIYAKLEEELNRLKNQGNDLDAALNDTLGVSNENATTVPKYEMPAEKKQAIENNKKLMSEINELIKSVDLYALA